MIKKCEIKNFKSIKGLTLDCKRVNVFIGRPNTGKSNILEAFGIFSFQYNPPLETYVRFENPRNLFYDQDIKEPIKIELDNNTSLLIEYKNGEISGTAKTDDRRLFEFKKHLSQGGGGSSIPKNQAPVPIKFYKFHTSNLFNNGNCDFLYPPYGDNLLAILETNKALKKTVAAVFGEYGFKLALKPQENKIELQKEADNIVTAYPYSLVSDTLQRVVFHLAAIETNNDSTLIFEEPESHSFPFYTKFLAERIALNRTNQYFIATHNPYLLSALLEKTPVNELGVFVTYFEDYQTKVKSLCEEDINKAIDLEASVFFNLGIFLGGK